MRTNLLLSCLVHPISVFTLGWRQVSIISLFHLCLTTVTFAQNKIWDKTIGSAGYDELRLLQQTSDGGYILGGSSDANKSGHKTHDSKGSTDYWIVKLDANGQKEWDKTIGGNREDQLQFLQQTTDGGYLLGGSSKSGVSGDKTEGLKNSCDESSCGADYWIVKLNHSGIKIWDKTIGGNNDDQLQSVRQTKDGGYIIGGSSSSGISGHKTQASKGKSDFWVVKLKADGTRSWDKTIGGRNFDYLFSMQQTRDGGYILGGWSLSDKGGDKGENSRGWYDYWVVKLNAEGTKVWDKTFGGDKNDMLNSLQQTMDGGYILGGSSDSDKSIDKKEGSKGNKDYWVIKLNTDGSKAWDKTIGGKEFDYLASVQQTNEGSYILGGYSRSGISGDKLEPSQGLEDYWVLKLNAGGSKVWDKTIGGKESDYLTTIQQTSNGSYILGGYSYSGSSGDKTQASQGSSDYWILKLNNNEVNLNQTITFDPIADKTYGDAPFTLSAKASSGLPVIYSLVSGPATIKNNIITLTGLGQVTVKALQSGNATYKPATATQTFLVLIPATVKWNKTFGGDKPDKLTAIIPTSDGGYLLGGSSLSGFSGDKSQGAIGKEDYWVVKTDKTGKKLWNKTYGGTDQDQLTALVATPDGGYLLGGYSASAASGDKTQGSKGSNDYWVIKIDASGTRLWDKTFGGSNSDMLTAIIPAPDGGFLLGGSSGSNISGDKTSNSRGSSDFWSVKINASGNKLWDATFGGEGPDFLAAVVAANEGGYLLGGTSGSGISGEKSQSSRALEDYWVVRLNENGTKVWDKTFGGSMNSYIDFSDTAIPYGSSVLATLAATPDGGFLLGGSSNAGAGQDKSEGSVSQDVFGEQAVNFKDYWVVKINAHGNKEWDNTYSGIITWYKGSENNTYSGNSELQSIVATSNGKYLLAGFSDSNKGKDKSENNRQEAEGNYNLYDYWVVQIDKNGQKLWDKTVGGLANDLLSVALAGTEGNFILGGTSKSGTGGDKTEPSRSENYLEKSDYWVLNLRVDENPTLSAWDLRYGGLGNEGFTTVIKTSDGGYLSGGYSPSGISGDKTQPRQGKNDYWIVKSDKNGQKIWDKRYGGAGEDYLNRIIQTRDGGYLLAGSSLSGASGDKTQPSRGDRDYWIVKITNTGVKQWDQRFGGSGYDELKKVIQLATGEYLLAGYSNSPAGGDKTHPSQGGQDYWLVKVSATGTKLWDKHYGGSLNETLTGLVVTADEGFLLGGSSVSGRSGNKSEMSRGGSDFWLVRVDKSGNQLWDKTYGGSGQDEAFSLGNAGSNFFISGQSDSPAGGDKTRGSQGVTDFWFIKITSTGAKVWDKRFGGTGADELRASIQTRDGGYLLAGKSFSEKSGNKTQNTHGGLSDYWIVKTDKEGMYQWDKRYGGSGSEELRAVVQTSDGGYLLAGRSDSGVSGEKSQPSQGGSDYWLVKVAPDTMPLAAVSQTNEPEVGRAAKTEGPLRAYPNPFKEKATVHFTLPQTQPVTVKVYDSQGRAVATLFQGEAKAKQVYELEWSAANQPSGLYFLQLLTPTIKHQQKLLLNRY